MKCTLTRRSKISPEEWPTERIADALAANAPAILIAEKSGAVDQHWLFLDCVGSTYLIDSQSSVERLTDVSPARGMSPAQFFSSVDEITKQFREEIPLAAGYLSYEALMEQINSTVPRRPDRIVGWYGLFRTIVQLTEDGVWRYELSFTDIPPEWCVNPHSAEGSYQPTERLSVASVSKVLRSSDPIESLSRSLELIPTASCRPYKERVANVQELIRAGEVYQANLSVHLTVTGALDPRMTALWLLREGRAARMAVLSFNGRVIASGSPELFLRREKGRLIAAPIKGTRPRFDVEEDNRRSVEDLGKSQKDRAELSMIVDLVRNDLNRVCEAGSVLVDSHAVIEAHPSVYHTVSTLSGRLKAETSIRSIWEALFPSGSITGAPKSAAIRTIALLESHWRDCYCGAIGYFGGGGIQHHNVAIRTITSEKGVVSLWAGGGVTIDSDPDKEYEECLWKLMPSLRILNAAYCQE